MSKPFLSTADVAELLAIDSWRVQRLYESGRLPEPQKIANRRVIPSTDLPEIVDALRERGWLPDSNKEPAKC